MNVHLYLSCVEVKDIINEIIKNPKYESICKKISEGHSNWEDLYHDFIVELYEPVNSERLLKASKENYLMVYCYGVISKMWSDRSLKKRLPSGNTSSLYNISDNINDWSDYLHEMKSSNSSDRELIKEVKTELNKLLRSDNPRSKRQGLLLKEFCNGKNRNEISKELGINYRIVHEEIEQGIIKIKANMNLAVTPPSKTELTITLRNEGCKVSYSGHTKTFYVDKIPASFIVKEVEQAGFKLEKK